MLHSLTAIAGYRQGDASMLTDQIWLKYIVSAEERIVNYERIQSVQELAHANPVLDYVERTLLLLDRMPLTFWMKEVLEEVLVWSETAKGGTFRERMLWQQGGINLFVHNVGSAQLYAGSLNGASSEKTAVIQALIETHGLIGQYIRGEVSLYENAPLASLVENGLLSAGELKSLLIPLNHCIIAAVSADLWAAVRTEVEDIVDWIAEGKLQEPLPVNNRLRKMRAEAISKGENFEAEYAKLQDLFNLDELLQPLADKTLWYVEPALQDFSLEEFVKVFLLVRQADNLSQIRHISFEHLMSSMYYDYKGAKKINVYKKRIIEKYLRDLSPEQLESGCLNGAGAGVGAGSQPLQSNQSSHLSHLSHLSHRLERKPHIPDTLFFTFEFSAAAEKLIEFCVEAEKSPLYEKAVLLLFDLFELRRDAYDRFHNEEAYLATMNQTADYKKIILDYIVGNRVIDIGPGGGVMLDLIEQELPDKLPIGIDISTNVIEALERKKQLEGHRWEVMKGDALNLQDYMQPGSVDTVIFSSILHELYSYIEFNGKKFNHDTVAAALQSAFNVLSPGGRIVIRDGIMTEPVTGQRRIRFLHKDGMDWLRRYASDFAGRNICYELLNEDEVLIPVNDAMEFLYTYTWGEEAYVHEVQEQFGYFTPSGYTAFISETLGGQAKIIESRHFLQAGYSDALAEKIVMMDENGKVVPLPDSTCIIVIEKLR
ncbi:class I SAM-dependent methyltransferase [Paenibacillus eucommiae]|uniref:SAM-dependent methyltransferase n=1 Tax=Paenibacillus eucommiae TaxID=1355755 RepID=A0ABS4IX23_9BACL|nr:class I SAM-dependent methyltransferase [Paenibacillus eucommiae]MBP1992139.1 SAM-dependent methyltransferase [Paenibacillus eucommiae]